LAWLSTIVLLVAGCGGAPEPTEPTINPNLRPPTFGERDSVFTDAQLVAAAYTTYMYPPGFPLEPTPVVPVFYVNTGSIVDDRHRPAVPWTELATEDVQQARAWAESTVANGNLMSAVAPDPPIVTSRYFEFLDVPGLSVTQVRMRVHRSSYLSGVLTYTLGPGDALATFNERPVAIENVGPLAVYLWWRSAHGPDEKVLSSFSTDTYREVAHTMYTLALARDEYDFPSQPDQLYLSRVDYRVDKTTGVIRTRTTFVREVTGRPN